MVDSAFLPAAEAVKIAASIDAYFQVDFGSQFARVIMFIISIITIVGNLAVLVVTIQQKQMRAPSNYFIFNLAVIDSIYASIMISTIPDQLVNKRFAGGADKCFIIGFGLMLAAGVSLFSLALLGIDRYLTVVRNFEWKKWQIQLALAMSWFMTFCLLIICPLANHSSFYSMKSSGMYCLGNYHDRNPSAIVLVLASILYICGTNVLIFFCYASVLKTYLTSRLKTRHSRAESRISKMSADTGDEILQDEEVAITWKYMWNMFRQGRYDGASAQNTMSHAQNNVSQVQPNILPSGQAQTNNVQVQQSELPHLHRASVIRSESVKTTSKSGEWVLFRKSATIFCVFNVCWIPFIVGMFYEVISGSDIPPWLDALGILGAAASSCVNPILNFVLDARYRNALIQVLASLKIKV